MIRPRRVAGFTLVEVLVVLALLGLVLASLGEGLALTEATFKRGIGDLERTQQTALAQDVLRRQVARALPVLDGSPGEERYVFEGQAKRLAFLLAEPPAPGRGGLSRAAFSVEPNPQGQRLVYTQESLEQPGEPLRSVLAEGAFEFTFAYRGPATSADGNWHDLWLTPRTLPTMIRLTIRTAGKAPISAIVRFRADAEPGCVPSLDAGFCRDRHGRRHEQG